MHQPQITVLQPLNHRSYSCHYHIFVGFSSKLIMAFVQPLHGEKGERRERNERVLENIPVDVMVRISIFPKLPCCICLASSSKPLQKLIFQDCIPLWHEINVTDLPYKAARILTDEMLPLESSDSRECQISHTNRQHSGLQRYLRNSFRTIKRITGTRYS